VPLLDGLARPSFRRPRPPPLEASRLLLPAPPPFGDRQEVPGRLRDERRAAARPHARGRGPPAAGVARAPLPARRRPQGRPPGGAGMTLRRVFSSESAGLVLVILV